MQKTLTVIARIRPDKAADLERLLDIIGNDIAGVQKGAAKNSYIDFEQITTVHFCRWAMIPNYTQGRMEYLCFVSYHDGSLRQHLDEWVDKAGEALDLIWGSCEGYPEGRATNPDKFKRAFYGFISKHSFDYGGRHIAYRGETRINVRRYAAVRQAIHSFLNLPHVERYASEELRHTVAMLPQTAPSRFVVLKSIGAFLVNAATIILFVLELIVRLFTVFVVRPLKNIILQREKPLNLNLQEKIQPGIAYIEDVVTQNQMTVISPIESGLWPIFKLKVVLCAINLVAKYFQNKGSLGGIATIHFAHWSIIDRGRYLLFISNYDGSWDSYIGDFVDKAAGGMDAVWRSYPRYPKRGAQDIEEFKKVIRLNQIRTQVFYSSYPRESVVNILNDMAIVKPLDRTRVIEWMRRL